ncbi:hypothetical protein PFISCL1PPCAC_7409, partial [Pristionchus fissidentatus]
PICFLGLVISQEIAEPKEGRLRRDIRIMTGKRVSQFGSFSCFALHWNSKSNNNYENIVDARLTLVEADDKEIPVAKSTREVLERAAIHLPSSSVCV